MGSNPILSSLTIRKICHMSSFLNIIIRQIQMSYLKSGSIISTLTFFILIISIFPLGMSSNLNYLPILSISIIWITSLLTSVLSLDKLFTVDKEDGSLELLYLTPTPFYSVIVAKIIAHWLSTGLPVLLASPLIAVFTQLPLENEASSLIEIIFLSHNYRLLVITLLIGTPILSLIGSVGASLTLGIQHRNVLISLITLPLYIPVLIFGVDIFQSFISTDTSLVDLPQIYILFGLLLIMFSVCPWISVIALRYSINNS